MFRSFKTSEPAFKRCTCTVGRSVALTLAIPRLPHSTYVPLGAFQLGWDQASKPDLKLSAFRTIQFIPRSPETDLLALVEGARFDLQRRTYPCFCTHILSAIYSTLTGLTVRPPLPRTNKFSTNLSPSPHCEKRAGRERVKTITSRAGAFPFIYRYLSAQN